MVHMRGFAHLQRATASCVSPKSSVFRYVPNPAFTFHPPVLFSFGWFWAVKLLFCGRPGSLCLLVWLVPLGGASRRYCYLIASDMVYFLAADLPLYYGSFLEVALFFAPLWCILFIRTLTCRVTGFTGCFFRIKWCIVCLLVPGTPGGDMYSNIVAFCCSVCPPVARPCLSLGFYSRVI